MIRHRRMFKNSYSLSWKLIVSIDFDVLADLIEHSIHCIIFFYVSKKEMHFVPISKDENVSCKKLRWRPRWYVISFSWQLMHKDYLEKLVFEWNKLRYFAVEWLLLNHKRQTEWWITNLQKHTKWFGKLAKILTKTKEF